MVLRHHDDGVATALQCGELLRHGRGREHVHRLHARQRALLGEPGRERLQLLAEQGDEAVRARGQHEDDARAAVACQPRGGGVGPVAELVDGGIDPLDGARAHAAAAVQHTVDRGDADAGGARDVQQAGADGQIHAVNASDVN